MTNVPITKNTFALFHLIISSNMNICPHTRSQEQKPNICYVKVLFVKNDAELIYSSQMFIVAFIKQNGIS